MFKADPAPDWSIFLPDSKDLPPTQKPTEQTLPYKQIIAEMLALVYMKHHYTKHILQREKARYMRSLASEVSALWLDERKSTHNKMV